MENDEEERLTKILRIAVNKITELKIEKDDLNQNLDKKSMKYEDCISEINAANKTLKAEKEKLNSENEKLHSEIGKLKQINTEYIELFQKTGVDYAAIDLEEKQVHGYIKAMVSRYEDLENALKGKENEIKEKDEKIKSLDDKISDLTAYNENLSKKYEELKGEGKESKDDSLRKLEKEVGDLGTVEGKIKEYESRAKEYEDKTKEMGKYEIRTKNWKKLAIILGVGLALGLGYIAYNHISHKTSIETKK